MASYTLTVPGRLQPKERPLVVTGKDGKRHGITRRATADQEYAIRRAWTDQVGTWLDGPVKVTLIVERLRPQTHWNAGGTFSAAGKREIVPAKRPDLDNYLKVVLDGLNGVAWRDDSAICGIEAWKVWAAGSIPCWTVTVEELQDASGRVVPTGRLLSAVE